MFKTLLVKLALVLGIFSQTTQTTTLLPEALKNEDFVDKLPILEASQDILDQPQIATSSLKIATNTETCVQYARRRAPQIVARVNSASEISATKENPIIGAWLLWQANKMNPDGHVSVVEEIKGDKILISEANLYLDGKITWRWIDAHNSKIKGYRY